MKGLKYNKKRNKQDKIHVKATFQKKYFVLSKYAEDENVFSSTNNLFAELNFVFG